MTERQGPRVTFDKKKPAYYQAGRGRGALGFGTSSALPFSDTKFGQVPSGYVAGRGRAMGALARSQGEVSSKGGSVRDGGDTNQSSSAFSSQLSRFNDEDNEADKIYAQIGQMIKSKKRKNSDIINDNDVDDEGNNSRKPKLSEQFADLKYELKTVTEIEWDSIPEVGDHSLKYKQKKVQEIYTPMPDFMLNSDASEESNLLKANSDQTTSSNSNSSNSSNSSSNSMSQARGAILSRKLDHMVDSVSGQTMVDPRGYLTSLNSSKVSSDAEIGDFKKARTLLSSVTATNPKHGPGWIAAARLEEVAGKMTQARRIIRQGADECPGAEDVWLEAIRLHQGNKNFKTILTNGIMRLPTSVRLWIKAVESETTVHSKRLVLRKALEAIPTSVEIWKTAIELESADDARILLSRAVECIPSATELWITLAKLETYENARAVLNKARSANPSDRAIWLTAAKLEEAHQQLVLADKIVSRAVTSLQQLQVEMSRDTWLQEALTAAEGGCPHTCAAIIKYTIHINVDLEDRHSTWLEDAENILKANPNPVGAHVARCIYSYTLEQEDLKDDQVIWMAAITLEKEYPQTQVESKDTNTTMEDLLQKAVVQCPHSEVLWLFAAKERWLKGEIPSARATLEEALVKNPDSEDIWLAAIKLEWENKFTENARKIAQKALTTCPSIQLWYKAIEMERNLGQMDRALEMVDQGLESFHSSSEIHTIGVQLAIKIGNKDMITERYRNGLNACPASVPLWLLAIGFQEHSGGIAKARSLVDLALKAVDLRQLQSQKEEDENQQVFLFVEASRLERRDNNDKLADTLLSQALKKHPSSGILWAEAILTCAKNEQKARSTDALRYCNNDPQVILAIARIFYRDSKIDKARKWFERTTLLDPTFGDAWVYWFAMERRQDSNVLQQTRLSELQSKFEAAQPDGGILTLWGKAAKSAEHNNKSPFELLQYLSSELSI